MFDWNYNHNIMQQSHDQLNFTYKKIKKCGKCFIQPNDLPTHIYKMKLMGENLLLWPIIQWSLHNCKNCKNDKALQT